MSANGQSKTPPHDARSRLEQAVKHFDHVLPGQAPILNFVHHNTLHGYQHLPFAQAVQEAEQLTGNRGYLPEQAFRRLFQAGRITAADLDAALLTRRLAGHRHEPLTVGEHAISPLAIQRIGMVYGVEPMPPCRFHWEVEEQGVLQRCQADLPSATRQALLAGGLSESATVNALWNACLAVFGLGGYGGSPGKLIDIPLQQAVDILAEFNADTHSLQACAVNPQAHQAVRAEALAGLRQVFDAIGDEFSLRGVLLQLTGADLLDHIRPALARFCAAYLDGGLAAWHPPLRGQGLYAAWRSCAEWDWGGWFAGLDGWQSELAQLPRQAVDAVIVLLNRLEIPEARWEGYLQRLALELPGWAGMINWLAHHPDDAKQHNIAVSLMDFLAIRLFLEVVWADKLCQAHWGQAAKLSRLQAYFERFSSEFLARKMLYASELPEFLALAVQKLINLGWAERAHSEDWRVLADMIWTWKHSPAATECPTHTVYQSVWRLFRLCQHLGLTAAALQGLPLQTAENLLKPLGELGPHDKAQIWLEAYEGHYREALFTALTQNHGRGRWAKRDARPAAQVIFCMDDREESLRRHLEELNPDIETLGAAGFFGVAMLWQGLDDRTATALCPVVVNPAHLVSEQAHIGQEGRWQSHRQRLAWLSGLNRLVNQELRRNLLSSAVLTVLSAPFTALILLGKLFFPTVVDGIRQWLRRRWVPPVPTRLLTDAVDEDFEPSPQQPRQGFTDAEQIQRVAAFLRNIGLTSQFAPVVVLAGHGSSSQNNPHLAAYDCGACSGRHGGPNARAFAALANRPAVRLGLAKLGIYIPDDTWFLGSEHNTGDDSLAWYDMDGLPSQRLADWRQLKQSLEQALSLSAQERCRRFASASLRIQPRQARRHVLGRTNDFSQARPELGHATNATAIVGRRSLTRGAFFDRRAFLISYDPTQDPDGKILEGILLAVGPVGAGINLEYYFSTVNNDRYGCGTKIPHNVTGLFGVMEGAASDLRTGLPRQMIEIHEAMRLQLVVESSTDILSQIYQRQAPLRELVGNEWLLLSAIHPETGEISRFDPQQGFIPWEGTQASLPMVDGSPDWYLGDTQPKPPALIRRPDAWRERNAA